MAKLVVYYSRSGENYFGGTIKNVSTGNTEKAARLIAKLTGAELFRIEQKVPYSDNYRRCTDEALNDKKDNARPELKTMPDDISAYDEIYLGYPNYWGTMPMAVFTFLESLELAGKTIHPFCTHEGSGLGVSERDIRNTAKGARVEKGLAINGSSVDRAEGEIRRWISSN